MYNHWFGGSIVVKKLIDRSSIRRSINRSTSVWWCLASAMKVFQSLGIVHRDLKPQNLLLCYSSPQMPAPNELTLKIGQNSLLKYAFLKETRNAASEFQRLTAEQILSATFFVWYSRLVCLQLVVAPPSELSVCYTRALIVPAGSAASLVHLSKLSSQSGLPGRGQNTTDTQSFVVILTGRVSVVFECRLWFLTQIIWPCLEFSLARSWLCTHIFCG